MAHASRFPMNRRFELDRCTNVLDETSDVCWIFRDAKSINPGRQKVSMPSITEFPALKRE